METGPYRATVLAQLTHINERLGVIQANQSAAKEWAEDHDEEHVELEERIGAATRAAGLAKARVQTVYTVVGVVFALAGLGAAVAPLFT